MTEAPLCLIGQLFVDVTSPDGKSRLGGLAHAARALSALDVPFHCAYVAPSYLDGLAADYFAKLGGTSCSIGKVDGAPNVFLIGDPKEVGDQGYVGLLSANQRVILESERVAEQLSSLRIGEVLVFPDPPYAEALLEVVLSLGVPVSVDGGTPLRTLQSLGSKGHHLECMMVSTSHEIFAADYGGDPEILRASVMPALAEAVLLKENRGGSRYLRGRDRFDVPAQVRPVSHSIGVGDCFSASFLALRRRHDEHTALHYCSWLAAEYAATRDSSAYRDAARRCLSLPADDIVTLPGVRVPWEERPAVNVYLAGPDFVGVDTSAIETVAAALSYHNFRARLPIRENGRADRSLSPGQRSALARKDLALLRQCQVLVAVLPFDEPGTLLEIGAGIERGMPVLVYSPRPVGNLMLEGLPTLVTDDLDRLIGGVFEASAALREGGPNGS